MDKRVAVVQGCILLTLVTLTVMLMAVIGARAKQGSAPELSETVDATIAEDASDEPETVHYSTTLSTDLQDYIVDLCEQYDGVAPELVMAIIQVESGGDTTLVGDGGNSYGLMQINVQYHKERMARLGVVDILDATGNIRVGVDYLAELYGYGRSTEWVLMAYNGGLAYATEMLKDGNVSAYARRVMDVAQRIGIEHTSEANE